VKFSNCCWFIHAVVHALQDLEQNFGGRLSRVNYRDQHLRIIGEHRLRFRFVSVKTALDDVVVCVVETVIFQGALLSRENSVSWLGHER